MSALAKPIAQRRPANRNNDLAAIHIAQAKLGMSKEDAQALKLSLTGKASAADMTVAQRRTVLAQLSTLQAISAGKPKPAYTGRRRSLERSADDTDDARWSKARALWALLARAGVVSHDTDAALTAWVQHQTGLAAWRFLNHHQITTVIESLKKWCQHKKVALK